MHKEIVKQLILEALESYLTSEENKRTPIGKGKDHIVYDYHGDPSKVIKVAWDNPDATNRQIAYDTSGNIVSKDRTKLDPKHIATFTKYPDLFPEVFKFTDKYAVIEKLDTERVQKEEKQLLDQLKPYINTAQIFDSVALQIYIWLTDKRSISREELPKLLIKMEEAGENLVLFKKYINFINKVVKTIDVSNTKSKFIDVRAANIGYDKKNKLKLLDF